MSFNYGDQILSEGMPSDKIYIVKDGECLVKHKVDQILFNKLKLNRLQPSKCCRYNGEIDAFAERIIKGKGFLKSTDVAISFTGDLLGLEACLPKENASLFSCYANSQPTILYTISKHELLKHFKMVLPAATEHFRLKNISRLKNTLKRLEKLLQLGTIDLTAEIDRTHDEPTILSGISIRDRLGSMITDKSKLKDLDVSQRLSEAGMHKFYSRISDISQKDSGSRFQFI